MKLLVKWIIGIFAVLLILLAAAVTVVGVLLKPEKLTPLIEKYAPEFINGRVEAGRIELTFWSTFPRLSIDIDSLVLISSSLDSLNPEVKKELPSWSDSLLKINNFHGSLNLRKLLKKEIEIYDVVLKGPSVNIVDAGNGITNYDISLEKGESNDSSTFVLSSISIDKFKIEDSGPLRYFSLPDSSLYEISVSNVELDGNNAPFYEVATGGNVRAKLLDDYKIDLIRFAVDGSIGYDFEKGLSNINLRNFNLDIDKLKAAIKGSLTLGDSIVINTLDVKIDDLCYTDIADMIPEGMSGLPKDIDTDLRLNLAVKLNEPYLLLTDNPAIPSATVDVDIPDSYIKSSSIGINISRFIFNSNLTLDGRNPDNSKVELRRLLLDGYAIDLDLRALITHPVSNPRIAGEVKGRIFTDLLPPALLKTLPGDIRGTIGLNTAFRFKKSELSQNNFHKIFARGTVSLRDFEFTMGHTHDTGESDSLKLLTPLAYIRFDSDKAVESNGIRVDSLLSLTFTADSLHYFGDGMDLSVSKLDASVGSKNTWASADKTKINPFGGHITMDRLRLISEVDSTRFSLREASFDASLSRFNDDGKVPLLKLSAQARRMSAAVPEARVSVSRPSFDIKAHMNPRRQHSADSLRRDSTRHKRREHQDKAINETDSVTEGLRNLLRHWDVSGNMSAKRARLFTAAFPINNTLTEINLRFNTDSVLLNSLRLKAGESDFRITGEITGIKKSIGRVRRKQPLKVKFKLESDTINVDELSRAVFAGAAAERDTSLWHTSVDESTDVASVINVDTTQTAPLLVPPDIDVLLDFRSSNVLYTNLMFHNFSGELGMWDSSIHLHDLYAVSPMGNIDVSAIYSAPSIENLEFGMGMQLLDFHLERFLQVTPAISELLPAMRDFAGVINAEIAMTTRLDDNMDFVIPSMQADVKIEGDSLVLLDADTFKSLSKWLLFKNKKRNMIDHMSVELQVDSAQVLIFPFIFNIDRYKLGVMGSNDLNMNFNYHVSVLKSPIPFKFGINISGNPDKFKIRLGGAKVKENAAVERVTINSDTRINLLNQLENIFRRSANAGDNKFKVNHDHKHSAELKNELKVENDTLPTEHIESLENVKMEEAGDSD